VGEWPGRGTLSVEGSANSVVLVLTGFIVLVIQSGLSTVYSVPALAPNLMLPVVIMLGVSQEVPIVRGATVSFVLGYLLDGFSGNLMSLQTFILVATFMLARVAGLRLFLRGPAFQIALTFLVALVAGGAILALQAIFAESPNIPLEDTWSQAAALCATAVTTALCAPLMFRGVNAIDSVLSRRREETA